LAALRSLYTYQTMTVSDSIHLTYMKDKMKKEHINMKCVNEHVSLCISSVMHEIICIVLIIWLYIVLHYHVIKSFNPP
jgi:hypothetical protein